MKSKPKTIPEIRMRLDKLKAIKDRLKKKGQFARALNIEAEIRSLEWVLNERGRLDSRKN